MSEGPHSELRRAARLAAIQALYQMEQTGEPHITVIAQFTDHRFGGDDDIDMSKVDKEFFTQIIEGVIQFQDDIDAKIAQNLSQGWKLSRLNMTLRALLRAGTFEVLRRPDVPALVVIDQYVSLAADFFDDKEAGFVNGLLDRLARAIRAAEFGITGPQAVGE